MERKSSSKRRSPTPSASSPSPEPTDKRQTSTEAAQRAERARRKEEKARLKALETPEQKRARRLAKKEAKAVRRRERMGEEGITGYSNSDNPFNDNNLSDKFVWHKKLEAAEEQGLTRAQLMERERERARENKAEIERMKQRRLEREKEMERSQAERDALLRAQEDAQFGQWIQQEDHFQLEQARLRSEIRVKEGRARPIDLLAKYLHSDPEDATDIDMNEPYNVFSAMNANDCEDLKVDIGVYRRMESHLPENTRFWDDMMIICEHALETHNRRRAQQDASLTAAERRALDTGINDKVRGDILALFRDKTHQQLLEMEKKIKQRLQDGDVADIVYWETLLRELKVQCAKARLKERHEAIVRHKMDLLRQQALQIPVAVKQSTNAAADALSEADARRDRERQRLAEERAQQAREQAEAERHAQNAERPDSPELEPAAFSPRPSQPVEGVDFPEDYVSQAQVERQLLILRRKVYNMVLEGRAAELHPDFCRQTADTGLSEADRLFFAKARQLDVPDEDPEEGDEVADFTHEIRLDKREDDYAWRDKYQPRKPRFFNRVFTGFEWNTYNRTHYDKDNPPPKMVQGYKFNIFYPDLIDKSQAPKFTLTPLKDEPGFAIIRFQAGPPYEDIAFKIVDRKWSFDRHSGYRCQFTHNNIFELHFRFRRERYRR